MARSSFLRRVATLIADNEFWLLWVYGAPLLLASNLPLWLLLGALCTVPFFWLARRSARGNWSVAAPLDVPLTLLLLLGLVGVAVSIDPLYSARVYAELLGGVALYFGLLNGLSETEIKKKRAALHLEAFHKRALDFNCACVYDGFGRRIGFAFF